MVFVKYYRHKKECEIEFNTFEEAMETIEKWWRENDAVAYHLWDQSDPQECDITDIYGWIFS